MRHLPLTVAAPDDCDGVKSARLRGASAGREGKQRRSVGDIIPGAAPLRRSAGLVGASARLEVHIAYRSAWSVGPYAVSGLRSLDPISIPVGVTFRANALVFSSQAAIAGGIENPLADRTVRRI